MLSMIRFNAPAHVRRPPPPQPPPPLSEALNAPVDTAEPWPQLCGAPASPSAPVAQWAVEPPDGALVVVAGAEGGVHVRVTVQSGSMRMAPSMGGATDC
jgi:hypothetical protein